MDTKEHIESLRQGVVAAERTIVETEREMRTADRNVEKAASEVAKRKAAVDALEAMLASARKALASFEELPMIGQDELLAQENARRQVRDVDAKRSKAAEALAEAERESHDAVEEGARLRRKLAAWRFVAEERALYHRAMEVRAEFTERINRASQALDVAKHARAVEWGQRLAVASDEPFGGRSGASNSLQMVGNGLTRIESGLVPAP
jgi:chromosome segregation ATPase